MRNANYNHLANKIMRLMSFSKVLIRLNFITYGIYSFTQ